MLIIYIDNEWLYIEFIDINIISLAKQVHFRLDVNAHTRVSHILSSDLSVDRIFVLAKHLSVRGFIIPT